MKKALGRSLAIVTLLATGFGAASTARADTAQEVFICKLNQGKTMADVNKVITDFNKMIVKLSGGDRYQAWLLTPVAADDLEAIVWVGEMPDAVGMATLQHEYQSSQTGHEQDKKFRSVMTCKSRSLWNSAKIK